MSCAASLAERRLIAGWLGEWRQPHALRNPLRLGLPSQLAHALYLGRSHLGRSHLGRAHLHRSHLGRAHLGRAHSAGENNGHTRLGVHMGGGLRGLLSHDGSRALWSLACFFACLFVLCLCLFASAARRASCAPRRTACGVARRHCHGVWREVRSGPVPTRHTHCAFQCSGTRSAIAWRGVLLGKQF